jgi:Holliday junction resolvase
METGVYFKLVDLRNRYGEQVLGQICQDLLALSFVKIGCNPASISVHNIEGVDIIFDDNNFGKYAIEVKTTSNDEITFGKKDYDGLRKYLHNDYKPILAILKIGYFKDWVFIEGERLPRPCTLNVNGLYTSEEYKGLAEKINKAFEELVLCYGREILNKGQGFLKEKLKNEGIRYSGG